jgi:hypothetical protein
LFRAVVDLIRALLQLERPRARRRAMIRSDIDLYGALPETSSVREAFLVYIDDQVRALISEEKERTRSASQFWSGVVSLGLALALAFAFYRTPGDWAWWFLKVPVATLAALLLIAGITLAIQALIPAKRDEKGRPL